MKMDYLEDFAMEDMLATTIAGLDLVREAIVDHSTTTQPASHAMHSGRDDQVDGIKGENLFFPHGDVPFDTDERWIIL